LMTDNVTKINVTLIFGVHPFFSWRSMWHWCSGEKWVHTGVYGDPTWASCHHTAASCSAL
jgi:hypothetical protein